MNKNIPGKGSIRPSFSNKTTNKSGSTYYDFKLREEKTIDRIDHNIIRKPHNSIIPSGITPDGNRVWTF